MMFGRKIIFGFVFLGFLLGTFLTPITTGITKLSSGGTTVSVSFTTAQAGSGFFSTTYDAATGELDCGLLAVTCGFIEFTVTITSFVSTLVTVLSGLVLDTLIGFSLSSDNYSKNVNTFIEAGWTIVRDAANILFIFGLLLAAFFLILQPNSGALGIQNDPKKIVMWVIIMALLVNFSLLFTKAIIDAGNITALVFYDSISEWGREAKGEGRSQTGNLLTDLGVELTGSENSSISIGIMSVSNPQSLMLRNNEALVEASKQGDAWYLNILYLFVSLMSFIFNLGLIFVFIVVGFLFAARTFGLWIAMILSPLAFVLFAVPIKFLDEFSFSKWFEKTVTLSIMAPTFLFFVYLAILFLGIPNISFGDPNSFFGNLIGIAIKLIASMFIILQGKKIATKMSGQMGEMISKFATGLAGLAVGGAIGGTAFMARQTLGRAGARVADSETLRDLRAGNVGDARDRLANKFGSGRVADFIRDKGRGGWFDKAAGSWVGKQAAGGILAGGRKVDEQSFDARDYGAGKLYGKEADMGDKYQRKGGYTKNKDEDTKERMRIIAEEAARMESSKNGLEQQEVDKKKAEVAAAKKAAEDASNPVVDAVNTTKTAAEQAEKELKNPANAAAAAVVRTEETEKEYLELTKDTFEDFQKDLNAQMKGKKRWEKLRVQHDFELANPEYAAMKDRRMILKDDVSTAKDSPAYKALKTNVATTRQAHVAATQDPAYKLLQTAIKNAEKALKDRVKAKDEAQARRLEGLASEYEKLIDSSNSTNTAFDTEYLNGEPMSGMGRAGRTYEGFTGSTTGVRGAIEDLRKKAKEFRDKK